VIVESQLVAVVVVLAAATTLNVCRRFKFSYAIVVNSMVLNMITWNSTKCSTIIVLRSIARITHQRAPVQCNASPPKNCAVNGMHYTRRSAM
jgi:predicted transglutaminase-like protease